MNCAFVLAVGELGVLSIPTVGGVTSTVQSYVAGLPTLLKESEARTVNVWAPSANELTATPDEHAA